MAATSYVSTPSPTQPTATQGLFPSWLANPVGGKYSGQYGYEETLHLQREIKNTIVDSIPQQFGILKILFDKPTEYRNNDEHTWTEELHARPILRATDSPVAASPQTITLTAGGTSHVVANDIIVYPDNTHGIISAVNTATNTIQVTSYTGAGNLPAVTAGDEFIIESAAIADGMNTFIHFDRLTTITYTNYISRGQRNKKWTTDTAIKYKHSGTTDYYERDLRQMMKLAMQDMLASFMNGQKGEVTVTPPGAAGFKGKMNWGVFPFMQQNGAMHAVSSPATIESDFTTLAFATDHQAEGATRFILGTAKALHALSKSWKDPVRYAPNDTVSSLDLQQYKVGACNFVPIVVTHFEKRAAMFPASFENRLIVLDLDKIKPTCLVETEPMMVGNTSALYKKGGSGGYNDYIEYYIHYRMGLEFQTVASSFWIDMINI